MDKLSYTCQHIESSQQMNQQKQEGSDDQKFDIHDIFPN